MREATPRRPALSLAMASAAGETSMAVRWACSRTEARAMAMTPEPVPTSAMRRCGFGCCRAQSRTASTRCSVSGRGMRTSAVDAESEAEELLRAGEVLERLLRRAAADERAEGIEVRLRAGHRPHAPGATGGRDEGCGRAVSRHRGARRRRRLRGERHGESSCGEDSAASCFLL